jgi:hypothetical protein
MVPRTNTTTARVSTDGKGRLSGNDLIVRFNNGKKAISAAMALAGRNSDRLPMMTIATPPAKRRTNPV